MSRKSAFIDVEKCDPSACPGGICAAMRECPRKILKQEAAYEVPFVYGDGSLCKGCFKCLLACPLKAVSKI